MEIDKWIGCHKVRVFPWVDRMHLYCNVQCFRHGQSLEQPPAWEKTIYILDSDGGRRLIQHFLHSFVQWVAQQSIPAGAKMRFAVEPQTTEKLCTNNPEAGMRCNLYETFDYYAIMENLYTMSDADRIESGEARSEYYSQYEENIIEVAALAGQMWQELSNDYMYDFYPHFKRQSEAWDCVIATLDGVSDHATLCAITGDDEMVYSSWMDDETREKFRKKLCRLTKEQLMKAHSWVVGWLARYMDLKAAYESVYSVVMELEYNNSMLKKQGSIRVPDSAWST